MYWTPIFPFWKSVESFHQCRIYQYPLDSYREKWPFAHSKNSSSQRYPLLGCGQICRIWPLVGPRRSFFTRADFSISSRPMRTSACDCRHCFVTVLSCSCWPLLPGLSAVGFFRVGRKPLKAVIVYFEMPSKGLTFQDISCSSLQSCSSTALWAECSASRLSTVVDFVDDLLYKAF